MRIIPRQACRVFENDQNILRKCWTGSKKQQCIYNKKAYVLPDSPLEISSLRNALASFKLQPSSGIHKYCLIEFYVQINADTLCGKLFQKAAVKLQRNQIDNQKNTEEQLFRNSRSNKPLKIRFALGNMSTTNPFLVHDRKLMKANSSN